MLFVKEALGSSYHFVCLIVQRFCFCCCWVITTGDMICIGHIKLPFIIIIKDDYATHCISQTKSETNLFPICSHFFLLYYYWMNWFSMKFSDSTATFNVPNPVAFFFPRTKNQRNYFIRCAHQFGFRLDNNHRSFIISHICILYSVLIDSIQSQLFLLLSVFIMMRTETTK